MTQPMLGRVDEADLREAWTHEAHQFTPWLLENLDYLSKAIGLKLEPEASEVSVGGFRADIIARDVLSDARVLIENQLECSDHDHLGKIMTYLSGLNARIVVWVAPEFREEHLSAIDWLNGATSEDFAFFAVRVRVIRIADSPLAPVMEVLIKPNEWERRLHAIAPKRGISSELNQQKQAVLGQVEAAFGRPLQSTGTSNRWLVLEDLELVLSIFAITNGIGLFIRGLRGSAHEKLYSLLAPHAARLQQELGAEMGQGQGAYFEITHSWNPDTPESWDTAVRWLVDTVAKYESVLHGVLRDGSEPD